jgi:hypothetical protein
MFSISKTEFTDLPAFVEKVRALRTVAAADAEAGAGGGPVTDVHDLRAWCAERGFLLHFSKTPSGVFYTLKYDRAKLTEEQYATIGRFRSVVFDSTGQICCVAPPKMLKLSDDMNTLPVNSAGGHLHAEEIVEGIMVNLFWHSGGGVGGGWYIATKSCVGEVSYDHIIESLAQSQYPDAEVVAEADTAPAAPAFQKLNVHEVLRRRICDVLSLLPGTLESLPKDYCYSLVIQHPKNQIVNIITVPKLYLVAVYKLSADAEEEASRTTNAIRIDRDIFSANFGGSVSHMPSGLSCIATAATTAGDEACEDTTAAATFTPHTVEDYCRMYASLETRSVSLPGVVFVDKDTGFCYKKRNPKYENVKKRKGMEQKLMAQYLQLRKDHGIDEYLKYNPQHSRSFRQFRDRLHDYTQRLYDAYIAHYVKKDAKPLKEYDRELKTHMYKLHYDVYLATLKETGAFVTKHTVINYVNVLAVAQQLACLNTGSVGVAAGVGSSAIAGSKTPIQRSSYSSYSGVRENAETRTGFRNPRTGRGGRMVPSLSVQIPGDETTATGGRDLFASQQIKGGKATGSVKVHNQFAGLDVD